MRIKGHATHSGTHTFKARYQAQSDYFKPGPHGLLMSSLGIGTSAGSADKHTNQAYIASILEAFKVGINVIDTAINYRFQFSEQAIGMALKEAMTKKIIQREEIIFSSKGGVLPFSPQEFAYHYLSSNRCREEELVDHMHCMAPGYLYDQLQRSLYNLGLDTLDIYYIDQVERHLQFGRGTFFKRLVSAFELLEHMVSEGKISCYGLSSWGGFREDDNDLHLLDDILQCAKAAAGSDRHHFKVVQVPLNLGMLEVLLYPNHAHYNQQITFLEAAQASQISVVATNPLLQGILTQNLPSHIRQVFKDLKTDALKALQFVRSAPGIVSTIVGMRQVEHVRENSQLLRFPLTPLQEIQGLFE